MSKVRLIGWIAGMALILWLLAPSTVTVEPVFTTNTAAASQLEALEAEGF